MEEKKKSGPYGPVEEWVEILKNFKVISQKAEELSKRNDPKWYFSDEGKAAYEAADTPAKKTRFFFDYLMAKKPDGIKAEEIRDVFFKTALVMTTAIDKSSLEYGTYPIILDEDKNPILKRVIGMTKKSLKILTEEPDMFSEYLLSALHGKNITDYAKNGYLNLSYCKEGEEITDLYKVERAIVGICCSDNDKLSPYAYYKLSFGSDDEEEESEEED